MESEEGKCGSAHTALQNPINFTADVEQIVLFYFHHLILCIFPIFIFYIHALEDSNL